MPGVVTEPENPPVAPVAPEEKKISQLEVLRVVLQSIERGVQANGQDMRYVAAKNGVLKAIQWLEAIEGGAK